MRAGAAAHRYGQGMAPRTRTRATRRVALVSLAAMALAAGCSSSGDGSPSAASTTRPQATTTTGATTTTAAKPLARYADYQTKNYDDPSHWVCRPDITDDICDGDLDATVVEADGTLTKEPFEKAADPPIDCFYVYPTISRDATPYSDWNFSPDEEGYVTLNQAARLQARCRLFAPVYRQVTLTALGSRIGGGSGGAAKGDPFGDVLDAFRTYMAEDNGGRGFVLIGHSQGSGMLNQLIKTEIDPNADVRSKLVGACLAGGAVAVPEGKVVGGDFAHVPLCTKQGEAGCVTTWATFRSTAPPPASSFFGKPRTGDGVAGCVNPAAIAGGSGDAKPYFPTTAGASILGPGGDGSSPPWVAPSAGTVETPFVTVPGLVTTECQSRDGFNYLEATVHGDPTDPRADDIPGDLTPEWGLHLVDVNLMMGNILDDVAAQAKTFAAGG